MMRDQFNDGDDMAPDGGLATWFWNRLSHLQAPRELPRLRRLPRSDEVIIIGGGSELLSTADDTTEVFLPSTREWRPGPRLNHPHRDAEVVELPDGALLTIGGSEGPTKTGSTNVELLSADDGEWRDVAPLNEARISHASCLLQNGQVLVTGGQQDPDIFLASCEVYDPERDAWQVTEPMGEVRAVHHLRSLPDGRAIAIGGGTDITATRTAEIYDPASQTWNPTGSMLDARWGFASASLDDGSIVVAGGRVPAQKGETIADDQMVILAGVERFAPTTERWSSLAPMHVARSMGIPNVELLPLPDGSLLFPGGRTYPFPYHGTGSSESFDPQSNSWTVVAAMRAGASYHAFITLPNAEVLTAGGRGARFRPMRRTEILGPATD
jgi:hypothetical protein